MVCWRLVLLVSGSWVFGHNLRHDWSLDYRHFIIRIHIHLIDFSLCFFWRVKKLVTLNLTFVKLPKRNDLIFINSDGTIPFQFRVNISFGLINNIFHYLFLRTLVLLGRRDSISLDVPHNQIQQILGIIRQFHRLYILKFRLKLRRFLHGFTAIVVVIIIAKITRTFILYFDTLILCSSLFVRTLFNIIFYIFTFATLEPCNYGSGQTD